MSCGVSSRAASQINLLECVLVVAYLFVALLVVVVPQLVIFDFLSQVVGLLVELFLLLIVFVVLPLTFARLFVASILPVVSRLQ